MTCAAIARARLRRPGPGSRAARAPGMRAALALIGVSACPGSPNRWWSTTAQTSRWVIQRTPVDRRGQRRIRSQGTSIPGHRSRRAPAVALGPCASPRALLPVAWLIRRSTRSNPEASCSYFCAEWLFIIPPVLPTLLIRVSHATRATKMTCQSSPDCPGTTLNTICLFACLDACKRQVVG